MLLRGSGLAEQAEQVAEAGVAVQVVRLADEVPAGRAFPAQVVGQDGGADQGGLEPGGQTR